MAFDATKYQVEFIRKTYRQYLFKVNKVTEEDMVNWLNSKKNVQAYVKGLIQQDMDRANNGEQ